jgi:pimeloyl-ACP methyl ester carboxylesterase
VLGCSIALAPGLGLGLAALGTGPLGPVSLTVGPESLTAQQPALGAREGHAELPGVRLFHTDSGGNGAAVVFVHAATGSSRVWEYQVPVFAKRGYRVITYDRRGFGRSQTLPSGPQPGTGADDLRALLDHLKVQRVHLVGTAAGGFVAYDFALSFPERLRSLVVANSIGGVQDESYLEMGRRLRPPPFAALPPEVRELGPSYRAVNPEGTKRWLELEHVSRPENERNVTQTFRNRVTFALLESIRVPALLLTGDADLFSPPSVLPLFASRINGSRSVVIPGAGHSAYWEQPEAFNRAILEFIGRN